jgi:two-component system, response regulator PdtaR
MPTMARILIVEDDVPTAMEMQRQLRDAGYEVCDFATKVATALQLAEECHPNLALVDIGLPDGDGVELAKKLNDEFKVRSIFVTSDETLKTMQRALDASPLDYLVKPISEAALKEAMEWSLLGLDNLQDVIRQTVPDADRWLDAPHERLGGLSPRKAIGGKLELELRRLLRAVIQGMPT